jgi:hypothetical protein
MASPFFLFLQRLPSDFRVMLGEDNYEDLQAVAVQADKLWAIHAHQQHGTIAAVEPTTVKPPFQAVKWVFCTFQGFW